MDAMIKRVIQSAWWIVFKKDSKGNPQYLLIKRYALSKKIEWVCPKGKLEKGEWPKEAAVREVGEETWLDTKKLRVYHKIWVTKLRNDNNVRGMMNKDTTYYLMEYVWDVWDVDVENGGWFIGIYKWASFEEVSSLIYYQDIRELIRVAHIDIINKTYQS